MDNLKALLSNPEKFTLIGSQAINLGSNSDWDFVCTMDDADYFLKHASIDDVNVKTFTAYSGSLPLNNIIRLNIKCDDITIDLIVYKNYETDIIKAHKTAISQMQHIVLTGSDLSDKQTRIKLYNMLFNINTL